MRWLGLALGAGLAALASGNASAQVPWSPLGPEARVVRAAPSDAGCLLCPEIRPAWSFGTFGAGRNPAGLAHEAGDRHAGFSLGTAQRSGDYRSPLEPESHDEIGARAAGWLPLGGAGGLAGAAGYREGSAGPGARRIQIDSELSSPWVVADSSVSASRSTEARLDAAGGWRIGAFGVGLAVGYAATEVMSAPSRTPRQSRASFPAASLGGEWAVPDSDLRVGAYGRWSGSQVTAQIVGAPTPGEITRLRGYVPPDQLPIGAGLSTVYYHRADGETRAGGATVAGRLAGWRYALWTEVGTTLEEASTRMVADPPTDRWETTGWEAGGEAVGAVGGGHVVVRLRHGAFEGEATFAESDSLTHEAVESATEGQVEALWPLGAEGQGWLVVGAGARFTDRDRGDPAPNHLRTEVQSRTLAGRIEAGVAVHPRLQLLGGYALTRTAVRGRLPGVNSLPPAARALVGPELARAGTPAAAHAPRLGVAWAYRPHQTVRLDATWRSHTPVFGATRLEATPVGSRSGWAVEIGFIAR